MKCRPLATLARVAGFSTALCLSLYAQPAAQAQNQAQNQAQPIDTIVVFDASGSMWGQIGGRSKIEIARNTLSSVLSEASPSQRIGMIAYGHRQKGACNDIESMVPVGPASQTVPSMIEAANRIQPKGKTPLTDAVRKAANELKFTENAATVILVTDGIETCNADPCALGLELEGAGINFTAHVVGFGLSQDEGRTVQCLAQNTGGLYLSANDADQLRDALNQTLYVAPPPPAPEPPSNAPVNVAFNVQVNPKEPYDYAAKPFSAIKRSAEVYMEIFAVENGAPSGEPLFRTPGEIKEAFAPGDYFLRATLARTTTIEKFFTVNPGAEALVDVNFNATRVFIEALDANGQPVKRQTTFWYDKVPSGRNYFTRGAGGSAGDGVVEPFYLPIGNWIVNVGNEGGGKRRSQLVVPVSGNFSEIRLQVGEGQQLSEGDIGFFNSPQHRPCAQYIGVSHKEGCLLEKVAP